MESTDEVWVSIGPSFSAHKQDLQDALGAGFAVNEMLAPRTERPLGVWIAVLGTSELPTGEILAQRRSPNGHMLLVGTGAPRDDRHMDPEQNFQRVLDSIQSCARERPAGQGPIAGNHPTAA